MKQITIFLSFLTLLAFTATAQINMPQPSPGASVSSTVGITKVSIDYFRPGVKGRTVFSTADGALVPYGPIWRTGANSGSIISFSTGVKVAGTDVKAGEYQIVSKPGASEWEVMLISNMIGGNMTNFDESKVVATAKVKAMKTSSSVERMSFQITDINENSTAANIEFSWADVMWKLPIEVEYEGAVENQIYGAYSAAANYYLEKGENLDMALNLMNLYLERGNNSRQFWNVHTKARILAAMGKKAEAIATATKSLEAAKKNPGGDFGYVARNEALIKSMK